MNSVKLKIFYVIIGVVIIIFNTFKSFSTVQIDEYDVLNLYSISLAQSETCTEKPIGTEDHEDEYISTFTCEGTNGACGEVTYNNCYYYPYRACALQGIVNNCN